MDPTLIQKNRPDSSLPVPTGPEAPEAYRRATTLLGAGAPGSQGAVYVWGVDEKRAAVRRAARITTWGTLLAASVVGMAHLTGFVPGSLLYPLLFTIAICACSLTTALSIGLLLGEHIFRKLNVGSVSMDDAGIGFLLCGESDDMGLTGTRRNESRCLPWNEIVSVQMVLGTSMILYTQGGKTLSALLLGYVRKPRKRNNAGDLRAG